MSQDQKHFCDNTHCSEWVWDGVTQAGEEVADGKHDEGPVPHERHHLPDRHL